MASDYAVYESKMTRTTQVLSEQFDSVRAGRANAAVLEKLPVPRLLIMTFVENSVKYGVSAERVLEIKISAQVSLLGNEPAVDLCIQDNGGGFPPEVLEHLRCGERLYGDGREHIGINNVGRRLELLYGRRYGLEMCNRDGGARINITVPLKPETELGDKR